MIAAPVPMDFPQGFLWGTATAAHQVEGDNVNSDCWLLEHTSGSPLAEPSGDACDHYHRYREDIATLAGLGFNAYRFSIEWARVEPAPGEFSRAVLDHYRRMLACCHEHALTPIVTLHHFTSPRWLAADGGWEDIKTAERFARYCERVVHHLGDLIGAACTLNEPNVGLLLQFQGWLPPDDVLVRARWRAAAAQSVGVAPERFGAFPFCRMLPARDVMLAAHRLGAAALKAGAHRFPVGMTLALTDMQAVAGGEARRDHARHECEDLFLEAARGDDFVGVQTYSRSRFGADGILSPEPGVETTQMNYEFWPEALEATIRYATTVARVPVLVTESGIATSDDTRRITYVERALHGVLRCIGDGIDVRGYCYWSAFDNFEWALGYGPKFGLIAVDRETQQRTVKPSAHWLGNIARANRLDGG